MSNSRLATGRWNLIAAVLIGLTCGAAHAQFPDLVVESISVQPRFPAVGQTVTVTVGLQNIGSAFTQNDFILLVWHDTNAGGTFTCKWEDQARLIEDLIPTGGQGTRYYDFQVTYTRRARSASGD